MRPHRRSRPGIPDDEQGAEGDVGPAWEPDEDPFPTEDPFPAGVATWPGRPRPDADADADGEMETPAGDEREGAGERAGGRERASRRARGPRAAAPRGDGAPVPMTRLPAELVGNRLRIRLRTGVGAAAALVAAALVVTILVTAVQAAGPTGTDGSGSPSARPSSHGAGTTTAHDPSGSAAGSDAADARSDGAGSTGAEADAAGAGSRAGGAASDADAADSASGGSAPTGTAPIYVHVVGAVVSPGLYPLASGSRVVDALAAAHGLAEGADPAGVNLARVLSDGEQLVVPREGEAPPAAASGSAGASAAGQGGTGSASPSAPVDLNTATAEQLETLPRVGPSLAGRIIAWRSAHGRFARVADLGRVPGIGDRTLASLTPLVRV